MNWGTCAMTQWSCAHTGNIVIDISIKLCPSIKLPYLLSNHIMFMRNTAQWNMPQLYTTDPPHANNLVWIPSSHSKNYTIHQCLLWSGAHHITAHCVSWPTKGKSQGNFPAALPQLVSKTKHNIPCLAEPLSHDSSATYSYTHLHNAVKYITPSMVTTLNSCHWISFEAIICFA